MRYVNYILALSNLLGVFSLNKQINTDNVSRLYIISIIIVSTIHHLTETNEVGHDLEGIDFLYLKKYGSTIRILDIFIAYSFFFYLLFKINLNNIVFFVTNNNRIILFSFLFNLICDFILFNQPIMYLFCHLFWHIGIYFIIYKITFIL